MCPRAAIGSGAAGKGIAIVIDGSRDWTRRALLAAPLAAAILPGCGARRTRGRLSLWAQDVEGENVKYVLPGAAADGVGVDLQWLAWSAAHEKLLTGFAGGSLPDVMMIARDWLAEFATIGVLAPLPGPGAAPPLLADQFAGADAAMRHDGRAWGVPWTLDAQVQYYRRDLLADAGHAAPPERLDEWRRMLHAVKRRGRARFAVLMQLDWPEHLFAIAAQLAGPPLLDRQSRGGFREPGFRAALAFYKSLFDEGLAPLAGGTQAPDPTGELARGFVAIYSAGAWTRADIRRRRAMPPDRWGIARLPGVDGPGRSVVAGAVLGVAHDAPDPARAWGLVRYLTAPATQLRLHAVAGTYPSRRAAWAAPALADDPGAQVFAAALADPAIVPAIPEWPRIKTEAQAIAERMARGQLSVDEAAAAMDARADALLAKRRWLLDQGRVT